MGDATQLEREPRPDHRLVTWAPYIVFVLGILLTALSAFYLARSGETIDRKRFRNAVQATQEDIGDRMHTYVTILKGGAGLFEAASSISRGQFHTYIDSLDLRQRYPGVQGIGYSPNIPAAREDAFVAAARRDGMPDFHIWPASDRKVSQCVFYLEPMDPRNRAAIGFDMNTDPVRREAMAEARDSGAATATGKVTLVQEIDNKKQAGFVIYVPVYRKAMPHETVSQRRTALQGFVYSPFRADDLLRGILGTRVNRIVDIEIYDGPDLTPEHRLHSSRANGDADYEPIFSSIETMDIVGRTWSVVYTTRPQFDLTSQRNAFWFALVGGVMFSFLLFAFLRTQVQARATAETLARDLGTSEEALRRANRAKDDFLATLSHELRTPLGTILIWSHLLREGKLDEGRRDRAVEMIERSTKTLVQLIDDLLDVSRIIAGKLSVEFRPLDLAQVVRAAIETAQPLADAKSIQLEHSESPMGQVSGDPGRLQQVVSNLLSNAIKFTPPNGRVSVRLDVQDGSARIAVTDTGQGITPEFLPYIFDRFRQADSTSTRTFSGLGLGLAIVRHLVDLHGGTVVAESAGKNQGSTFTVKLPLLRARRAAQTSEAARAKARGEEQRPLRGVRVLVVDDEDSTREALTTVLEQSGANVTAVASARDALEAVGQIKPDVLLSDIAMPNEDGYGLMRKVRALKPEDGGRIPAAALTAYATAEDRSKALRAGYQAHVPKPFDPDRLIDVVTKLAHAPSNATAEPAKG